MSRDDWQEREHVLNRFEDAWRRGPPPALDDYLPPGARDRDVLAELVHTDLEYRLKAGEPARVEAYLQRFPELAEDPEVLAGLLATEFELRQRREPDLSAEEYARRFPRHAGALDVRLHGRPGVSIAGYELLGVLGRGGMGIVYKARQTSLNRVVAVKIVLAAAHAGPRELARFRREAEAAARLQHPNIVQVHAVGEQADRPFLVMEYVEGGSLARCCAGAAWEARRAAGLVETLAAAMHAAHQRGIIHRDLKPANVLLAADGTPKITDFGLAKQIEEEARHTHSGAILGTPAYMAPEQAAGHHGEIGSWTDVYALGAILYELLTGRPPFKADTALATLQQVLTAEPVPPARLRSGVPGDLETICLKCLHRTPARRYGSALELAEDLRRFRAGEPIRARPAGPWERGVKWARRRPAWAALFAMAVLTAAGAAAAAAWFTAHLQQALDRRTAELRAEQHARERSAREQQYLQDVRLAAQYWKHGETQHAAELLRRHRPAVGAEDDCDFAWRFLWRQCDRLRADFAAHDGGAACVAFAPDGKVLATGGADRTVKLWDAGTGELRATLPGHAGAVHAVAFAPDGMMLASAGEDRAIRVWDPASRREQFALAGLPEVVECLAFSPDGRWLASGDRAGNLRFWDVARRAEHATSAAHAGGVLALAFSPDGRSLVSTGWDTLPRFWDVPTGALRRTWGWDRGLAVALSHDGRWFAAANPNGGIAVGDARGDGPPARRAGHPGRVHALAISADDRAIISAGADGTVRVWDVDTGQPRAIFRGHRKAVLAVAAAPAGRLLASAGADGSVKIWDAAVAPGGEPAVAPLRSAGPLAFTSDGKALAVVDRDHGVTLVDPAAGTIRGALRGHASAVHAVACSPAGSVLATAGQDRTVRLWQADRGAEAALLTGHRDAVLAVGFSGDGRWLASGGADRDVRVWDVAAAKGHRILKGHEDAVLCLAFAPDGGTLASGDAAGVLRLWDPAAAAVRATVATSSPVLSAAYSPDGRTLATGHRGPAVRLWDQTGKLLAELAVTGNVYDPMPGAPHVYAVAFSPDGRTLVAGAGNGFLIVWDVRTRRLKQRLQWYAGGIRALAFAPDGRALAISRDDGTTTVWDPVRWLARPMPGQPPRPVSGLCFSPDGRTLVTGSAKREADGNPYRPAVARTFLTQAVMWDDAIGDGDADVRLWDVTTGAEVAGLPGQEHFGVSALALSGDGHTLLCAGHGGVMGAWDLPSRRGLPALFATPRARTAWENWHAAHRIALPAYPDFGGRLRWTLALAPDGKTLAVVTAGTPVQLREVPGGRELGTLPGSPGMGACAAFAPDGATLALGDGERVGLWDVTRRELRRTLSGHTGAVDCVSYSADGRLLATGGQDRAIKLWTLPDGRGQVTLIGHTDRVVSLAFSPDGRTLASASWDGTARLWHVASGQELVSLEGHPGRVYAVGFSPDGGTLASGGGTLNGTGEILFWRAGP